VTSTPMPAPQPRPEDIPPDTDPVCRKCKRPAEFRGGEWHHAEYADAFVCQLLDAGQPG